jgi:hypothetical protein
MQLHLARYQNKICIARDCYLNSQPIATASHQQAHFCTKTELHQPVQAADLIHVRIENFLRCVIQLSWLSDIFLFLYVVLVDVPITKIWVS